MRKGSLRPSLMLVPGVLCLVLLGLWLRGAPSAQEDYCDPALDRRAGSPLRYSRRGDRCEGIYIKEVASTTLLIASLTESFEDYDLTSGADLHIEWTAPGEGSVLLRAQGLRPRLHYRMDTVRPPVSRSYRWPVNILAALQARRKDIGVVGWTRYPVGDTQQNVLVALRIGHQRDPVRVGSYQLVVLPGRELTEVYISLAPVGADGRPGAFLRDGEPLEYGYYPARRAIAIPISDLQAPGVYYVEIGATLKGGGATTRELWFFHPGG